ncbi:MAG: phenylalanine--tRNA ligase subunit beta [Sediminibacterium sp.]|jgi:phenylalanyl-tRNA synthetase beta chain|nr:phenylalanine--tRNA ligase subunit beta [Sediminibacterium sp.]
MTISYNWLSEYLPWSIEPEKLSKILTSIGLEVESLTFYENVKGGLAGLTVGEVLTVSQHPNADKLKITTVNIGAEAPLQIICGASNVAVGQKVIVATIGTTIYPSSGDPLTMRVAKIRGEESFGMICAEDEIGLGTSHDGIIVLAADTVVGTPAATLFEPYQDWVYEIGLTPNRMDAMSHYGVAKDVCAYLTHHEKEAKPVAPFPSSFAPDQNNKTIAVSIENEAACKRYAGVELTGVKVSESPAWLKNRLTAIGVRPINNIVDVTNYILHETGQPLHAFDAAAVTGGKVIVKNVPAGTAFTTLDTKERKLQDSDLLICNATDPMCIAGVFGGAASGVHAGTTSIFLESAWFHPTTIRKTSLHHGLRTDAATRFEKGVDIASTVSVLKRAALLIKEVAGGIISSDITDIYPAVTPKTEVVVKYHYIKKLSGKNYHPEAVKKILTALGFEVIAEGIDELRVAVPYSKPDISIPADLVEEILRIDGLDNIEIPTTITISPAVEVASAKEVIKEKTTQFLVGKGFVEIFTNSITNSQYFTPTVLETAVKMMNNLSADLDVLRPSMLETGLETIAYNCNRRNHNLRLFEFGKTYATSGSGQYSEKEHLCIYLSGLDTEEGWRVKSKEQDLLMAKGILQAIATITGLPTISWSLDDTAKGSASTAVAATVGGIKIATLLEVSPKKRQQFDIKQGVVFVDIDVASLVTAAEKQKIVYKEVSKFPAVQRDLALVVDRAVTYAAIELAVGTVKLPKLKGIRLFDVFESDKLGVNKKSMALSFTFVDEEKTMTDTETDSMVSKLIGAFEKELGAEIRK